MERNHPEYSCEKCSRKNMSWFIDSKLWNKYHKTFDILCPICFTEIAEENGIRITGWELKPENLNENDKSV